MDTCAVSEVVKKRPDGGLAGWMRTVDPLQVYISVVTLGELRKGIECCNDAAKKATLESWLTNDIATSLPVASWHSTPAWPTGGAD